MSIHLAYRDQLNDQRRIGELVMTVGAAYSNAPAEMYSFVTLWEFLHVAAVDTLSFVMRDEYARILSNCLEEPLTHRKAHSDGSCAVLIPRHFRL